MKKYQTENILNCNVEMENVTLAKAKRAYSNFLAANTDGQDKRVLNNIFYHFSIHSIGWDVVKRFLGLINNGIGKNGVISTGLNVSPKTLVEIISDIKFKINADTIVENSNDKDFIMAVRLYNDTAESFKNWIAITEKE